tara:strand:+ start:177 stop:830 length:654 start_codon:yes stop_codon:yes gene_type:complete
MSLYSTVFGTGAIIFGYMFFCPIRTQNFCKNISWKTVEFWHRINIFVNTYWTTEKVELLEEEGVEEEIFLLIEGMDKDGDILELKVFEENELSEMEFEILFLKLENKGKTYYKRINVDDELFEYELKLLPRQFLQVEFENKGNKTDIHEYISKYYVDDNTIFDDIFVKYYMKKWYDNNEIDDYRLNIIDKNITLINLTGDDSIFFTNDSYLKNKKLI